MADQQDAQPNQPHKPEPFMRQFAKAPLWQRVVLGSIFASGFFSGIYLLAEPYIKPKQHPPYVEQIDSLAARLQQASDTGDYMGAAALYDPVAKLLQGLADDPRTKTDASARYCLVAALHLSQGTGHVARGTRWERTTFDNAMRECKQ